MSRHGDACVLNSGLTRITGLESAAVSRLEFRADSDYRAAADSNVSSSASDSNVSSNASRRLRVAAIAVSLMYPPQTHLAAACVLSSGLLARACRVTCSFGARHDEHVTRRYVTCAPGAGRAMEMETV
jgi:hypothetical protein